MKKILCFLFVLGLLQTAPVYAAEEAQNIENVATEQNAATENQAAAEEISDMADAEDFKNGAKDEAPEIQPLNISLSLEERQQENSTDVDFIEKIDELPDLPCDDANLRKQVEAFIYKNISETNTDSAVERRERVLLVRNLHEFTEISREEIRKEDGFNAQAALMNLRINLSREVTHICASRGNKYSKFKSVYLIIYQFANFYKVVVSNLIEKTAELDEATFIYNWQSQK
ncbi:MAG: hypothetical protein J6Y91_05740 [Alphaproteobacteria bacterium]|nr:hypothetical protein [Alphaproteobacteria bacterium]